MKLAELVGKSWVVRNDENNFTIFVNVRGVDLFTASYDGKAGYVHAEAIYEIEKKKFMGNIMVKIDGDNYPTHVGVGDFEEKSYNDVMAVLRDNAREMFPELF